MNAISYHRKPWTDENHEELTRLHNEGRTDQQIAEVMGRTRAAIISKREELGLQHGQFCSGRRQMTMAAMSSSVRYENFTRDDVERVKLMLAEDYQFSNINLIGLPKK